MSPYNSKMTGFGHKVWLLMAERHIYNWAQLHRAAKEECYLSSRQQMMNYVHGDSEAPVEFARYLVATLEKEVPLTDEQKREYSYAWAYQQAPKVTALEEVANTLEWDENEKATAAYRAVFGS